MRIQYISDLHLDSPQHLRFFESNELRADADILILGGDIVPLKDIELIAPFLDTISADFEKVYWVLGNHELYGVDYQDYQFDYLQSVRHNVFLINNTFIRLDGVEFVFSTLWSQISSEYRWHNQIYINDFKFIRYNTEHIDYHDYNFFHEECVRFIRERLSDRSTPKKIVVTHHCPIALPPDAVSIDRSLIGSYCSDLEEDINKGRPHAWLYGHTHANIAPVHIGDTPCITNQFVSNKGVFNSNTVFVVDN